MNIKVVSKILLFAMSILLTSAQLGFAAVKGSSSQSNGKSTASEVTAPEGTPTREIQNIEVKMDAYKTGEHLTEADKAENRRIKRDILTGTFDIRELCHLSLDKHWDTLSEGQRDHFVNLMTDLLETKAIFAKEQSKTRNKKYRVRYLGDRYSDKQAKAKSFTKVIVFEKDITLDINYQLKKSASNAWKIFDVIVDEASLVENYRYQFDTIITKHGYSELVKRMEKKYATLKEQG